MSITPIINALDAFQQKHPLLALPYAIIKKYGDDDGGYQAALITYYGFLSIFPLLLVLVTVLQLWFGDDLAVRHEVTEGISRFFPLLGDQLQQNVHSIGKSGLGLIIGILVTIYGARGAADVFRHIMNNIWQVPRMRRAGFPHNIISSLVIMLATAFGFGASVLVSGFSATLGHAVWVKVLANIAGFAVMLGLFLFVARAATMRRVPVKDMIVGSTFAAVAIQILLTFGSIMVAHQLKNLNALYGTFAIVLGLLFWIYLLAQVIIYAVEIDSVRHLKLWPRGLQGDKPTEADLRAYELYARVDQFIPKEEIDIRFKR
jgi:membrane protein